MLAMTKIDASKNDSFDHITQFTSNAIKGSDIQITPLAGDASHRKYYRVFQEERSWVLMEWEPFKDNSDYPFLSVLNHFSQSGVRVPKVIAKDPLKGLILLEDLGDLTLERKFWEFQKQSLVIPFYHQAIDELIKIHFTATDSIHRDCTAFKIKFDTEKFLWEMNYAKLNLIDTFGSTPLSESEAKILNGQFLKICQTLDSEPKRISHRDYHSRNLMLKLGKMRVIDFQDARMGPVQYDLVSLLHDSYVDISDNVRAEILNYYLDQSKINSTAEFSMEQFQNIFNVQLIQRCFKACGSFTSFFNNREDRRYLHYVHPTLAKVQNILNLFPEYSDFNKILEDKGLLEIDYETL